MSINKTVARSRKRFSVIGVAAGGQLERMDVMLSDCRHWLEYDSVALAVLLVGIGFIELIVLSI